MINILIIKGILKLLINEMKGKGVKKDIIAPTIFKPSKKILLDPPVKVPLIPVPAASGVVITSIESSKALLILRLPLKNKLLVGVTKKFSINEFSVVIEQLLPDKLQELLIPTDIRLANTKNNNITLEFN